MSEQHPEASPGAAADHDDRDTPDLAELLDGLQQENLQLQRQIDELTESQVDGQALAERLGAAENANAALRKRHDALAIDQALSEAAAELGISPRTTEVFRTRFACQTDKDGKVVVTPDPREILSAEVSSDPLLMESRRRGRQDRGIS